MKVDLKYKYKETTISEENYTQKDWVELCASLKDGDRFEHKSGGWYVWEENNVFHLNIRSNHYIKSLKMGTPNIKSLKMATPIL